MHTPEQLELFGLANEGGKALGGQEGGDVVGVVLKARRRGLGEVLSARKADTGYTHPHMWSYPASSLFGGLHGWVVLVAALALVVVPVAALALVIMPVDALTLVVVLVAVLALVLVERARGGQ